MMDGWHPLTMIPPVSACGPLCAVSCAEPGGVPAAERESERGAFVGGHARNDKICRSDS